MQNNNMEEKSQLKSDKPAEKSEIMQNSTPLKQPDQKKDEAKNERSGIAENFLKIQGDLNLTVNCSDFQVTTEAYTKEKNSNNTCSYNDGEIAEELKNEKPYSVIWISAPTKENAVDVATLLLEEKLVSSVNILDGITTMNMKEGKIETVSEVIVKMKTETSLVPEIIKITDEHFKNKLQINDAEILSTTLKDGNYAYFKFVSENTKDSVPLPEENPSPPNQINLELPEGHILRRNLEISGQLKIESQT
jgi:periplasmic divalent cation tolerance protein